VLYYFTGGNDGQGPGGTLIFDKSGNIYGTASGGGAYDNGVVFELSLSSSGSWTETTLYAFTGGADGGSPFEGVVFDTVGNLYGTTYAGGTEFGVVFELSPPASGTTWNETVLHTFARSTDGGYPLAGLNFDSAGNLYGTTSEGGEVPCYDGGGDDGCGVVFQLTPGSSGWNFNVIFTFNGDNGTVPSGPLAFDSTGNLYGTTGSGGILSKCYGNGCGVVYELSPAGGTWNQTLLHVFQPGTGSDAYGLGGGDPNGSGVLFDGAGTIYGIAGYGGSNGDGVVFKLLHESSGTWKESVVYNFTGGSEGEIPLMPLTLTATGDLLGTTYEGGNTSDCNGHGCGVLYEVRP